jgi:hypothetical protein
MFALLLAIVLAIIKLPPSWQRYWARTVFYFVLGLIVGKIIWWGAFAAAVSFNSNSQAELYYAVLISAGCILVAACVWIAMRLFTFHWSRGRF